MDEMHEITELLREIRDLQKAHFERYKEFTQAITERQKADAADLQRFRDESRRYREEVRATMLPRWVPLAIVGGLLALGLGGVIVAAIIGAFMAP